MAYGKNIFIFGGNDARQKFNDLITIDLEKKNARIIAGEGDIPSPRFGHTSEIYKNNMYIFGGWNGSDTLDELYTYSFISNIFYAERLVSGMHPPARYRHSSTIIA